MTTPRHDAPTPDVCVCARRERSWRTQHLSGVCSLSNFRLARSPSLSLGDGGRRIRRVPGVAPPPMVWSIAGGAGGELDDELPGRLERRADRPIGGLAALTCFVSFPARPRRSRARWRIWPRRRSGAGRFSTKKNGYRRGVNSARTVLSRFWRRAKADLGPPFHVQKTIGYVWMFAECYENVLRNSIDGCGQSIGDGGRPEVTFVIRMRFCLLALLFGLFFEDVLKFLSINHDMSNASASPKPSMGRLQRHGSIGAHIAPAKTVAATGEHQRMIFPLIVYA
jgi:hypothetical protein